MTARRPLAPALAVAAGLAVLSGCAAFPDFGPDRPLAAGQGYPAILPLGALLAQGAGGTITPDFTASLEARGAALRARAALLRRPVIDRETRARIEQARARLGDRPRS
jgi:hypothetical protein